jgi:Xaa-Pro dipeptidase
MMHRKIFWGMTSGFRVIFLAALTMVSCREKMPWQENLEYFQQPDQIRAEIAVKMVRLKTFMEKNDLQAVLLSQVRNIYWVTAGLCRSQRVFNEEIGMASLLILKDGRRYLVSSESVAPRLMDENLRFIGYELISYPWYRENRRIDTIKQVAHIEKIGCDVACLGTVFVGHELESLRYSLTEQEIERYRWLGRETTEAVAEVCRRVQPGMGEYEIQYLMARDLRSRGILPVVLLTPVDERIFAYGEALPGGATLKKYAMIDVVGEKWGLCVAVTRFVHLGPVPKNIATMYRAAVRIMTQFQAVTIPGRTVSDILEESKSWYSNAGFEESWKEFHQGGAIGYKYREYVAYPYSSDVVQLHQAFAWNPMIQGVKAQNTFIVHGDSAETLTVSQDWPMVQVKINGNVYSQPGILVR